MSQQGKQVVRWFRRRVIAVYVAVTIIALGGGYGMYSVRHDSIAMTLILLVAMGALWSTKRYLDSSKQTAYQRLDDLKVSNATDF